MPRGGVVEKAHPGLQRGEASAGLLRRPPHFLRRRFTSFHVVAAGVMFMLVVFLVVVLLPEERIVDHEGDTYRAECGLEYFFWGAELEPVAEECRSAYRDNALVAGLTVLSLLVLGGLWAKRRSGEDLAAGAGWLDGWRSAVPPSSVSARWVVVTVLLLVAAYLQVLAGLVR